jgi:hypothetical protein
MALQNSLQGQLELICSRDFEPVRVLMMNPQIAFCSLTAKFENVVINLGGASNFVPKVDAKIRRIKKVFHSIMASLGFADQNTLLFTAWAEPFFHMPMVSTRPGDCSGLFSHPSPTSTYIVVF